MLSIKKMSRGSEEYYLGLLRYFFRGGGDDDPEEPDDEDGPWPGDDPDAGFDALPGEPAGIWLGTGADRLGLWGVVEPDVLRRLMRGVHPVTEEPLVQNANQENRCPGWDFTFSSPKSVSIVWSQASPAMRKQIQEMQEEAVRNAILRAEEFTYSRTGKGGLDHVPVGLVVAAFEHATSRLQDQNLHTHCLVLNLGVDELGKTRSIASQPLYAQKMLLGAYYRAMLAHFLTHHLGFTLRRAGRSFEVVGVPEQLIDACSQRRAEVVAQLKERGLSGGKAAAVAALDTRRAKGVPLPREQLIAVWQNRNAAYGFSGEALEALRTEKAHWTFDDLADAIDAATKELAERQSHFSESDFLREVLYEAPARGLPPEPLLQLAEVVMEQGAGRIIALGVHDGQRRFSTSEVLAEEKKLLDTAELLRQQPGVKLSASAVESAINHQLKKLAKASKKANKGGQPPQLSSEQRAAVEHLTQDTLGTGSIRIVQGLAGTGKTKFVLAVAHQAWTDAGYRVIAATPTGKAARVLQEESGIEAKTIALHLGRYKSSLRKRLLHDLRQYKRAIRGRRTYRLKKPAPVKVDARTILLVDEAAMVNTADTLEQMELVQKAGGMIVLTGDAAQLPPVGRGAPFQSLSQRLGCTKLTDIKRQDERWARDVAQHASAGRVHEALSLLAQHDAIHVSDTPEDAIENLVQAWAATGLNNPRDHVILANTNEQTEKANVRCQELRLQAGYLPRAEFVRIRDHDPERGVTYEQKLHRGDRVLFTRNDRRIGVENGALGTVIAMRPLLGNVAVKLDSGPTVLVSPKNFPHMRLGYALTTYKAQGDTFPKISVLIADDQQTQPAFYVQVTRAKHATSIFTTRALWNAGEENVRESGLAEVVSRAPDLRLATDLRDADAARPPSDAAVGPAAAAIPESQPSPGKRPHGQAASPKPEAQPLSRPAAPMAEQPAFQPPRYSLPASFLSGASILTAELPTLGQLPASFLTGMGDVGGPTASQQTAASQQVARGQNTSTSEHLQAVIRQAANNESVPSDRIEVIATREWDEALENVIRHWIEITYRVTKYLPSQLAQHWSFLRSKVTVTETWEERSNHIAALFLPQSKADLQSIAGTPRGAAGFFANPTMARIAIQNAMTARTSAIEAWKQSGSGQRLQLDVDTRRPLGLTVSKGSAGSSHATSLRVVLQKNPQASDGFTVWTAYPLSQASNLTSSPQPRLDAPQDVLRYFFQTYLTVPANFQGCDAAPQAVADFRRYESPQTFDLLRRAVAAASSSAESAPWFKELQLEHTLPGHYASLPNHLITYLDKCIRNV